MPETIYINWPDCPVPGCTNKICLALNSDFCFPHTPGNEHVKRMKIDALHPTIEDLALAKMGQF